MIRGARLTQKRGRFLQSLRCPEGIDVGGCVERGGGSFEVSLWSLLTESAKAKTRSDSQRLEEPSGIECLTWIPRGKSVFVARPADNGRVALVGQRDGIALNGIKGSNRYRVDQLGLLRPDPRRCTCNPRSSCPHVVARRADRVAVAGQRGGKAPARSRRPEREARSLREPLQHVGTCRASNAI